MVSNNNESLEVPADLANLIRTRVGTSGYASTVDVLRAAMALLNSTPATSYGSLDAYLQAGIAQANAGQVVSAKSVLERWRQRDSAEEERSS